MRPLVSLESVPIIDNHCHAGGYEERDGLYRTIREHEEWCARGFIEARVPPSTYHEYADAVRRRDVARLEEIDRTHHVRDLMHRSLEMRSTSVFTRALRIGCMELYGEWEDQERLAVVSAQARRDGAARLYERTLELVNTPVVLTDPFTTSRLDRAVWSEERFKWIFRIDPFLYPFGPGEIAARGGTEEVARFSAIFAIAFNVALREQGLDGCPTDFADYLAFVDRVLESVVERGAVGFKVVSAYLRSLEFRPVAESEAARVFRDLARGHKQESRLFEDYMARRILLWAASRGSPVQVHTGMGNAEPGMDFFRNNPLLLQSILMDERYSNLRLVLLHGAYPYCSEAGALAWTYGNVYLDFSWMPFLHHHFLIDRLSEWLEFLPAHKVLFGTDTGIPELHVGATRLGRRALEIALSRGLEAGLWTARQADWLGERVFHRNARELYGIAI